MFLKFLKNFFLKRKLKNSLTDVKNNFSNETIKTVGIIIDANYFNEIESLLQGITSNGIYRENITVLLFKDRIKKSEVLDFSSFTLKDIDWNGNSSNAELNQFQTQYFDLLISYYDIQKPVLSFVTQKTKANFKAGFATIDKRLNHFMINTIAENHKVFTEELFKYLKILNKI